MPGLTEWLVWICAGLLDLGAHHNIEAARAARQRQSAPKEAEAVDVEALLRAQDVLRDLSTPVIDNFSWVPVLPVKYKGVDNPDVTAGVGTANISTHLRPGTLRVIRERFGPPFVREVWEHFHQVPRNCYWWYAVDAKGARYGIFMMISAGSGDVYTAFGGAESWLPTAALGVFSYQAQLRLEKLFGQ